MGLRNALAAAFLLMLAAPAWGLNSDTDSRAYRHGDDATAMRERRLAAERGDARAQLSLGIMHGYGQGGPRDYAEVGNWYRKAAEQGHAGVQLALGEIYYRGHGVAQDHVEAVKWFRRNAHRGVALAEFFLGLMYDEGLGVSQSYTGAPKWYRKAADQGLDCALVDLGLLHFAGKRVPRDYVKAHKWFSLAVSRLPPGEDRELSAAMRDGLAERMSPEQIAEARRLAREWKPKE